MRGASLGVDEDVGQVVGHGLGVVAFDVDDHGVALLDAQTHDGQDGTGRNGVAAFLAMVTVWPEAVTACANMAAGRA